MDDELKDAFVVWEAQMAAYWDAALRNPDFLRKIWPSVEAALQARRIFSGEPALGASPAPPSGGLLAEIVRLQATAAKLEQRLDDLLTDSPTQGEG